MSNRPTGLTPIFLSSHNPLSVSGHTIGFHISAPCFLHTRDSQPDQNQPARYSPFPRIMHGDPLRSRYDNQPPSAGGTASYTSRTSEARPAAKEGGLWGFRAGEVSVRTRVREGTGKKRKRVVGSEEEEGEEGVADTETWLGSRNGLKGDEGRLTGRSVGR